MEFRNVSHSTHPDRVKLSSAVWLWAQRRAISSNNIKESACYIVAVIPAGFNFLPQTKAMPKEMLPIVDKPVIQTVVEELVDGIEIIIATGYHKRSIEDHFDSNFELKPSWSAVASFAPRGGAAHQQHGEFLLLRQKAPKATPLPSGMPAKLSQRAVLVF